jgi:hypothetical protein
MSIKESQLQDLIRLELGRVEGLVLFRNNVGNVEARQGYRIAFGVGGPGGADLIGIYRGRFCAVEIKTPTGRQSPDQVAFQNLVRAKGGIYVVLRSVEDARLWAANLAAIPDLGVHA